MNGSTNPTLDEVMTSLQRLKQRLRARGIVGVAVFGSRARGDHRPESDLDLLVDVQPNTRFSLLDLVGVSQAIGDELGVPANMFMRRSLDPEVADSIRPDIIEVFHE
jgi:predicted nucleotidyltransferase